MDTLIESIADKISRLHVEIVGHLRQSLEKAQLIGRLLTEQKKKLKHGEFGNWIESNLPFTNRTARNYMRLYRERDRLKTETVSDLKSAYRLLKQPAPAITTDDDLSPWDELTADHMKNIIDSINDDLEDSEHWLDPDAKWFFDLIAGYEMFPENVEHMAIARKIEVKIHYCEARNKAWHKGMASLPEPWQRLLQADGLVPTKEPHKMCGGCWLIGGDASQESEK